MFVDDKDALLIISEQKIGVVDFFFPDFKYFNMDRKYSGMGDL